MNHSVESIRSSNGQDTVHIQSWSPDIEPIGVVQLIHGMIEHIARYDDFARFLVSLGYVVIGHDHVGHGETAGKKGKYGHFGEEGGAQVLVDDCGLIHQLAAARYPECPYFILGHSMGSLVLRNYLFRQPQPLNGAIIMGTTMEPAILMKSAQFVTQLLKPFAKYEWPYQIMDQLVFGKHNQRFRPNRTTKDWLSSDEAQVDLYLQDPHTQFHFSLAAYRDLFALTKSASDRKQLQTIDPQLPLLLISGDQDPVGHYGKSVYQLAQQLEANTDITVYLLENGRHEILNEKQHMIVYKEMRKWLSEKSQ
ncbi:alpha/beta fold hydrolase [Enterococcus sp. DIV0876]|uniref:alpha/beta fold hydrolase n=1 Tax=Enterococcus sp. DIV0876 TaxID=2774633 RepID=UPI003D2FC0E5